jgi:AraC-like DNA-binding protein
LARAYRRHYHRSVGEELRRLRVDAVRAKIASGDFSLAAAAAESGFADQSHMSRVFRRLAGMSPGEFRELSRRRAADVYGVPER